MAATDIKKLFRNLRKCGKCGGSKIINVKNYFYDSWNKKNTYICDDCLESEQGKTRFKIVLNG